MAEGVLRDTKKKTYLSFLFLLLAIDNNLAIAQSTTSIDLLPRQEIDLSKFGLNAFGNEPTFGSPGEQYSEIRSTLGAKHLRLLFAWTEDVQPTPESPIDHSFNDELIRSLPSGSEAVIVLANAPQWMTDSENWIEGNPRLTFHRKWVRPIVQRYRRKRKVIGFQIFNEPNSGSFFESTVMGTLNSPENYMEMIRKASRYIRRRSKKKVIGAATSSILQNFPETLEYNESLRDLGVEQFLDVFAIHLYGTSVERYFFGIGDFLNSLTQPIWVTESGVGGASEQLNYVERLWPFFAEEVPAIERFYFYQFAEVGDSDSSFGLRNSSADAPLSDLYLHLKSRNE